MQEYLTNSFHVSRLVKIMICDLVGNTPMVYLKNVTEGAYARVAAKLEVIYIGPSFVIACMSSVR